MSDAVLVLVLGAAGTAISALAGVLWSLWREDRAKLKRYEEAAPGLLSSVDKLVTIAERISRTAAEEEEDMKSGRRRPHRPRAPGRDDRR